MEWSHFSVASILSTMTNNSFICHYQTLRPFLRVFEFIKKSISLKGENLHNNHQIKAKAVDTAKPSFDGKKVQPGVNPPGMRGG